MANVKFTDLPNLASITASTIIPVVDANVNYSVTTANLQSYVNSSLVLSAPLATSLATIL
jgi:hypothetical protein